MGRSGCIVLLRHRFKEHEGGSLQVSEGLLGFFL
jgi:hypothetical protein